MGMAKRGGNLLEKPGITRLSELEIDADKDWQAMGITNIRELVAGMNMGDMLTHDDTGIVILTPGDPGLMLTTDGPGNPLAWRHRP